MLPFDLWFTDTLLDFKKGLYCETDLDEIEISLDLLVKYPYKVSLYRETYFIVDCFDLQDSYDSVVDIDIDDEFERFIELENQDGLLCEDESVLAESSLIVGIEDESDFEDQDYFGYTELVQSSDSNNQTDITRDDSWLLEDLDPTIAVSYADCCECQMSRDMSWLFDVAIEDARSVLLDDTNVFSNDILMPEDFQVKTDVSSRLNELLLLVKSKICEGSIHDFFVEAVAHDWFGNLQSSENPEVPDKNTREYRAEVAWNLMLALLDKYTNELGTPSISCIELCNFLQEADKSGSEIQKLEHRLELLLRLHKSVLENPRLVVIGSYFYVSLSIVLCQLLCNHTFNIWADGWNELMDAFGLLEDLLWNNRMCVVVRSSIFKGIVDVISAQDDSTAKLVYSNDELNGLSGIQKRYRNVFYEMSCECIKSDDLVNIGDSRIYPEKVSGQARYRILMIHYPIDSKSEFSNRILRRNEVSFPVLVSPIQGLPSEFNRCTFKNACLVSCTASRIGELISYFDLCSVYPVTMWQDLHILGYYLGDLIQLQSREDKRQEAVMYSNDLMETWKLVRMKYIAPLNIYDKISGSKIMRDIISLDATNPILKEKMYSLQSHSSLIDSYLEKAVTSAQEQMGSVLDDVSCDVKYLEKHSSIPKVYGIRSSSSSTPFEDTLSEGLQKRVDDYHFQQIPKFDDKAFVGSIVFNKDSANTDVATLHRTQIFKNTQLKWPGLIQGLRQFSKEQYDVYTRSFRNKVDSNNPFSERDFPYAMGVTPVDSCIATNGDVRIIFPDTYNLNPAAVHSQKYFDPVQFGNEIQGVMRLMGQNPRHQIVIEGMQDNRGSVLSLYIGSKLVSFKVGKLPLPEQFSFEGKCIPNEGGIYILFSDNGIDISTYDMGGIIVENVQVQDNTDYVLKEDQLVLQYGNILLDYRLGKGFQFSGSMQDIEWGEFKLGLGFESVEDVYKSRAVNKVHVGGLGLEQDKSQVGKPVLCRLIFERKRLNKGMVTTHGFDLLEKYVRSVGQLLYSYSSSLGLLDSKYSVVDKNGLLNSKLFRSIMRDVESPSQENRIVEKMQIPIATYTVFDLAKVLLGLANFNMKFDTNRMKSLTLKQLMKMVDRDTIKFKDSYVAANMITRRKIRSIGESVEFRQDIESALGLLFRESGFVVEIEPDLSATLRIDNSSEINVLVDLVVLCLLDLKYADTVSETRKELEIAGVITSSAVDSCKASIANLERYMDCVIFMYDRIDIPKYSDVLAGRCDMEALYEGKSDLEDATNGVDSIEAEDAAGSVVLFEAEDADDIELREFIVCSLIRMVAYLFIVKNPGYCFDWMYSNIDVIEDYLDLTYDFVTSLNGKTSSAKISMIYACMDAFQNNSANDDLQNLVLYSRLRDGVQQSKEISGINQDSIKAYVGAVSDKICRVMNLYTKESVEVKQPEDIMNTFEFIDSNDADIMGEVLSDQQEIVISESKELREDVHEDSYEETSLFTTVNGVRQEIKFDITTFMVLNEQGTGIWNASSAISEDTSEIYESVDAIEDVADGNELEDDGGSEVPWFIEGLSEESGVILSNDKSKVLTEIEIEDDDLADIEGISDMAFDLLSGVEHNNVFAIAAGSFLSEMFKMCTILDIKERYRYLKSIIERIRIENQESITVVDHRFLKTLNHELEW